MISRTYVEQLLRNFQTLGKEFLCHACPYFQSEWGYNEDFRRQWRSWAEQFVSVTDLKIVQELGFPHVEPEGYALLASRTENHHEVRVAFLNWVLKHAELS
jgi:hypothetical protein